MADIGVREEALHDAAPVLDEGVPARASGRRWAWLAALLAVTVGLVAVFSVGFGRNPRVVESVLLDRPAPSLSGPTLDGGSFDLADHAGKVVVVNVWASWCTACREEHPELEAASRRLAPYGVQFVGIDTQDSVEAASAFLQEMGGSSYPSVLDPDGRKSLDWGVFGVPETFLVDATGRVRRKAVGAVTEDWLVANVAPLVAEAQSLDRSPTGETSGTRRSARAGEGHVEVPG